MKLIADALLCSLAWTLLQQFPQGPEGSHLLPGPDSFSEPPGLQGASVVSLTHQTPGPP